MKFCSVKKSKSKTQVSKSFLKCRWSSLQKFTLNCAPTPRKKSSATVWNGCMTSHGCLWCSSFWASAINRQLGTCPHLNKWLGTDAKRTANQKLTKLYWPSSKRST